MFRFGLDMIGLWSRGSANGRSGMVRPVHPVSEMSTASSSSVRGARGSDDVQLSDPASIELPRLTRCERVRAAWQDGRKIWAVTDDDAGHAVVCDPVQAERRVDLRAEVHGEKTVTLQSSRGHQDEYAESGVGE